MFITVPVETRTMLIAGESVVDVTEGVVFSRDPPRVLVVVWPSRWKGNGRGSGQSPHRTWQRSRQPHPTPSTSNDAQGAAFLTQFIKHFLYIFYMFSTVRINFCCYD